MLLFLAFAAWDLENNPRAERRIMRLVCLLRTPPISIQETPSSGMCRACFINERPQSSLDVLARHSRLRSRSVEPNALMTVAKALRRQTFVGFGVDYASHQSCVVMSSESLIMYMYEVSLKIYKWQ